MTTPARPDVQATLQPPRKGCWRMIRNALLVGLLLLTGAVLWGWMLGKADERAARMHEAVMRPYFHAVTEGRLHDAWSQFTTARYRQQHPFADYERAQTARRWVAVDRIGAPGKLAARLITGGVRVKYYQLTTVEAGDPPIVFYELIDTDNGPKIDATYRMIWHSFTSKTGRRSAEEDRVAEPW